jgi:hypothetical protein
MRRSRSVFLATQRAVGAPRGRHVFIEADSTVALPHIGVCVASKEARQSEHGHEAEIAAACEMQKTESFSLDEYDDYLVQ